MGGRPIMLLFMYIDVYLTDLVIVQSFVLIIGASNVAGR
jgi:hypothetical protein